MEQPNMMTVREIARTGLLSEHALRLMLKAGKLPAIYIGKKALINYDTTTIMARTGTAHGYKRVHACNSCLAIHE